MPCIFLKIYNKNCRSASKQTCMADKKRDILEFVEQSNFEQFTPTRLDLFLNFFNVLAKIKQNKI